MIASPAYFAGYHNAPVPTSIFLDSLRYSVTHKEGNQQNNVVVLFVCSAEPRQKLCQRFFSIHEMHIVEPGRGKRWFMPDTCHDIFSLFADECLFVESALFAVQEKL